MQYLIKLTSVLGRGVWVLLGGVALLLNQGCSSRFATTGENLYKHSRNGPMLVVPPPLTQDSVSSFYVLPNPSNPAG